MTILQNEYARGSIVFDCDYRTGSIADKSPYKAAATVTAPASWGNNKRGRSIQTQGAGKISYEDNASNRVTGTDATFIFLGDFFWKAVSQRLVAKRSGAGTSYDIYISSGAANRLDFFDGTNIRTIATGGLAGRKCIVLTMANGGVPACYLDGTFVVNASGAVTIPNTSVPLLVGNDHTGGSPCTSQLSRILILNRALSAAEISQLYQELMAERYPLRAYSFGCRISAPKDPPGVAALLKTDFTTRLADGRLADLSGNGWHGTIKPGFVAGPGMCGQALVANSASRTYVDFGEVPINGVSKLTIVHYGQRGASNPAEILIDKGTAITNRNEINQNTTQIAWNVGSGGVNYRASINDANISTPLFQAWSYNGDALVNDDKVKVNFDGTSPAVSVAASFPSTLPNTVGTPFTVGRLGWSNNNPPPKQSDFLGVYLGSLTHEQTEYIRKQIARRSTFALDMQRVPVSLANLVGPCEVPNTPFRLQSGGTWKVSEDAAGKRWFESVAGNYKSVYVPSTQAYGTYVFDVYHNTGAMSVMFGSNTTDISAANRNMYAVGLAGTVITLYKLSPSNAFTILFASSNALVANTLYTIAVTRNSSGQFYVYIKGGAYGQWTLLTATSGANPSTDTAYTTSSFFAACASTAVNAGKFGNVRMFAGPLTRDQLQEACP